MAPAVTVDVTLTQSHSFGALKSDSFAVAKSTHATRRTAPAAAAPAGPEQQQEVAEDAVLQAPSSSSSPSLQEFDQLCNSGSAWTWSNFWVKLYRYTLLLTKQVYLIFMTLSLRTNHLMVSCCSSSSSTFWISIWICTGIPVEQQQQQRHPVER
jgi:hypothetical protein